MDAYESPTVDIFGDMDILDPTGGCTTIGTNCGEGNTCSDGLDCTTGYNCGVGNGCGAGSCCSPGTPVET